MTEMNVPAFRALVTGTHCAGKSTLCRQLQEEFRTAGRRLAIVGEIGQEVAGLGLPLGIDATVETYSAFVRGHVRNLLANLSGLAIFDRGLVDLLAYAQANRNAPQIYNAMLWELARWQVQYFDLILYLVPDFPFVDSTLRSGDDAYRMLVDKELKHVLSDLGIAFHTISGSIEERKALASHLTGNARLGRV